MPLAQTLFLLSPARLDGRRAQMLLNPRAGFALAVQVRETGAPLGEVFSFMSGLYFRGKLTYGRTFARPAEVADRVLVITPGRGLVPADTQVGLSDLAAIAEVGVAPQEARFREPLARDAAALAAGLAPDDVVVLLGSIATGKYVDILLEHLGERLRFPAEFVGRGDMSRGGLLLRRAQSLEELAYVPIAGAVRHGKRPPRLEPIPRKSGR